MIYAIISIGLLGFIVWAQMGLLHSDVEVTNFAICWNDFTLLGTFYSKNPTSLIKSAGNRRFYNAGSSETTRETSLFNFSLFQAFYNKLGYANTISEDWLVWFIGFAEGDGAILSFKGRPTFVLCQKEGAILYHIQSVLGFGKVRQSGKYYRYSVTNLKEILILCVLFNGNLVLPYRITQLGRWIININASLINDKSQSDAKHRGLQPHFNFIAEIEHIVAPVTPTLTDAWISGFTDAEGTFNVIVIARPDSATGYRVRVRFFIDQKNALAELLNIRNLFGFGRVKLRNETDAVYRYSNDSLIGQQSICDYFKSFPLKTKKGASFDKWLVIYNMVLNKEHLTHDGLQQVRELSKLINV